MCAGRDTVVRPTLPSTHARGPVSPTAEFRSGCPLLFGVRAFLQSLIFAIPESARRTVHPLSRIMTTKQANRVLRKRVIEELDWTPSIDSSNIGVAVKEGVVTLSGQVPTYAQKRSAERAILRVSGVRGVANDIEVHLTSTHERTDADIAQAAVRALDENVSVPSDAVQVTVDRGWITLKGTVSWDYQRTRAERAVRYLTGVKGVKNLIELKEEPTPNDLRRRIKSALERRVDQEAKDISVNVDGGTVTLQGSVPSWTDREDMEDAVWGAPGVRKVENKLKISSGLYA